MFIEKEREKRFLCNFNKFPNNFRFKCYKITCRSACTIYKKAYFIVGNFQNPILRSHETRSHMFEDEWKLTCKRKFNKQTNQYTNDSKPLGVFTLETETYIQRLLRLINAQSQYDWRMPCHWTEARLSNLSKIHIHIAALSDESNRIEIRRVCERRFILNHVSCIATWKIHLQIYKVLRTVSAAMCRLEKRRQME